MKFFTQVLFALIATATMADIPSVEFGRVDSLKRKRILNSGGQTSKEMEQEMRELTGLLELGNDVLSVMSLSMSLSFGPEPTLAPTLSPSASPSSTPSASPSAAPSVTPSAAPSESPSSTPSVSPSVSPSGVPSSVPSDAPSQNADDDLVLAPPATGSNGSNRSISPWALGATIAMSTGGLMALIVWAHSRRSRNKDVAVTEDVSLAPVSILSGDRDASVFGGASAYSDA